MADDVFKIIPAQSRPTLIENLIVTALGARNDRYYGAYEAKKALEKALRAAPKHVDTARRIISETKDGFTETETVRRICEKISQERLNLMPARQVDALINGLPATQEPQNDQGLAPPSQDGLAQTNSMPPAPPAQSPAALPAETKKEDILALMQRANEEVLRRSTDLVQAGKGSPEINATIANASLVLIQLAQMPDAVIKRLQGDAPPSSPTL